MNRKGVLMYNIEILQEKIQTLFAEDKHQEAYNFCVSEIKKIMQRIDNVENLSDEEAIYLAELYSIIARITPPETALEYINSAINLIDCSEYYIQRGKIEEELGDIQGAFNDYSIVIDNEPCFEAYGYRGSIYLKTGNTKAAIDDFTKSVELNNNYGGGYINRGLAKYSLNDFEGAIKDYDIAIEQYPDYTYTYGCRIDAKIKLNNFEGALADCRKILELEPDNINAKKTFLDLKMHLAEEGSINTIVFTKKDGTKVEQFITDEGIIELPLEE